MVLDDINLTPWLKFGAGATCQTAMMVLFFFGYSDQPVWVNIVDIFLATTFISRFYAAARKWISDEVEKVIAVAVGVRIKWTVLYLLLASGLTILMLYQIPYLPKAVTGQ